MPSCERLHAAQNSGTVVPIGVTTPRPVTTTRCGTPAPCIWTLSPVLRAYGARTIMARAGHALAAAAPELAIRARTRSTTEPTVLKSDASSLAL